MHGTSCPSPIAPPSPLALHASQGLPHPPCYAQVDALCATLLAQLPVAGGGEGAAAARVLGLDVEFATLENDLRMLPAMLQLAWPGQVGLIWLDKLPDHGHGLLQSSASLKSILSDPSILKVR